jgi:LPS-assembly protein
LDDTGRETGFLIPTGENSSTKGLVIGEEFYWVINRSMDMTVGAEYWSKRGWAPRGNFRYKGQDLNALTVRWNALLDRGIEETLSGATSPTLVNQGGTDILAFGRKDLSPNTRVAGNVEYLSSYIYRLAFDPNLAQATSSEVQSDVALTKNLRGFIPSLMLDRFQSFAGSASTNGAPVVSVPEVRILHLPSLRFDVPDRPLPFAASYSPVYWGLGSSIADLSRAEPHFHARNVGRLDLYPHLEWPLHLGDWNILPEVALRTTQYSGQQIPDLLGTHFNGVPYVTHDPLNRSDVEASLDIRPPILERDFTLNRWNRELRHVIEPEIFYRYVTGINHARQVLQFDPADIATNTNEAGYSLTQRFYLKRLGTQPCIAMPGPSHQPRLSPDPDSNPGTAAATAASDTETPPETKSSNCAPPPREWASWQITQKFFIDPSFGGALIHDRRNIFDSTLDLTGVAFLTSPRSISPVVSRVRFEAIDRLRIEWDFDYDPKAGRVNSDNVFAGYSFGRATVGLGHALLNAADESGSTASVIQSQQVQPFIYFGKPSDVGLSVGMTARYDFTHNSLQYGGVQAIYNWNCCGLNLGYRKFALGSLRDESEWLWGFTLSSIGTAGNIHTSTAVFPTPDVLSRMY